MMEEAIGVGLPAAERPAPKRDLQREFLDPKRTVFTSPTLSVEAQAPTSWQKIHEWDRDWTVKKGRSKDQGEEPFSDFLGNRAEEIFKLGWKEGFITAEDIADAKQTENGIDSNPYTFLVANLERKKGYKENDPVESHKYKYDKDNPPKFPKRLDEKQRYDLMALIYAKVIDDPIRSEETPSGEKIVHVGNDFVNKIIEKYGDEANKYAPAGVDYKGQEQFIIALNIATRKALDQMMLAENITPTDRVLKKLGERMVVAEEVKHPEEDRFIGRGKMGVTREKSFTYKSDVTEQVGDQTIEHKKGETGKSREAEPTFEIDMMEGRALEVVIPPEEMANMQRDFYESRNNPNYAERAKAKIRLEKRRQMMDMAVLEVFGYKRDMKGLDSLANERDKYFSQTEQRIIDSYKSAIDKRVKSLGGLSGEFGKMDPLAANRRKTVDLVMALVDEGRIEAQATELVKKEKVAKAAASKAKKKPDTTPTMAEITAMKLKLRNEFKAKAGELLDKPRKVIDTKAKKARFHFESTIEESVEKSGLLKGTNPEEADLIANVLVAGIKTRESISPQLDTGEISSYDSQLSEGLLKRLDRKEPDKKHNLSDYTFDKAIRLGLKGKDFELRNIMVREVEDEKLYPGYKVEHDEKGNPHLQSKARPVRSADGTVSQNPAVVDVPSVEPVGPAPTPSGESASETQKAKDSRSVELAALLNIPDVNNYEEFRKSIENRFGIAAPDEVGGGTHIEYEIPILELTDAAGLESLSHLAELFPDNKIRVVSLGLTVEEGKKIESVINGMEISTLVLSGSEAGDNINQITFEDSTVSVVEVTQGKFVITTVKEPDLIRMNNGNGKEKIIDLVLTSERSLNSSLDTQTHGGTIFQIDSSGSVIVDLHRSATDKVIIYSDLETGDTWSNSEKIVGENVLVFENGVYKLKQIPEAAKPSTPAEPLEEKPAATPLGEFKPLPPEKVAQMEPGVKLKYHQDELRSNEGSSQKRKAVGEILQILSESGVDVSELNAKFETLKTVKKGPDLAGSQVLRDLIEEVQKLTIPEPTPAPESPTSTSDGEALAAEEPAVAKTAPPVEELPPATEPPVEFDPEKRIAERLEEIRQRREKEAGDNAAPVVATEPPVEASSGTPSPVTAPPTAAPSSFTSPPAVATEPPTAETPEPSAKRPGFWSRLLRREPKPPPSPPLSNSERVRQRNQKEGQKKNSVVPEVPREAAPEEALATVPVPPRSEPVIPPQTPDRPAESTRESRPLLTDASLIDTARRALLGARKKFFTIIPGELDGYLGEFLSLLNDDRENPAKIVELIKRPFGTEVAGVSGVGIQKLMVEEMRDVTLPLLNIIISKARGGYPNARLVAGELVGTAIDAGHLNPEHNYSTAVELMNVAVTKIENKPLTYLWPDSPVILQRRHYFVEERFMKAMEENVEMMIRLRDASDMSGIVVKADGVSVKQRHVDSFALIKAIYENDYGYVIVEDGGRLKFKQKEPVDEKTVPTEAFISRIPGGELFIDAWERVADGRNTLEFEALGGGFRYFQQQAEYLIPKILGERKTKNFSGDLVDAQRALYKYLIAPSEDLRVELSTEFDEIYKQMLKSDFQETDISSADFIARYRAEVVELDRLKYGVKGEDDPVDKTVGSDLLKQISKAINPRDVTDLGPIREKGLFDKFSQQFNYVIDKMFGKSDVVSYYYLRDRLIRYFMSPEKRTDDGLKKALDYLKAQGVGVEENYSVVNFVAAYRQELYRIDRQGTENQVKQATPDEEPKRLTPEEAAKPWKEKFVIMKQLYNRMDGQAVLFDGYKNIQEAGYVEDFEKGFKIVLSRMLGGYDFKGVPAEDWQRLVRRFLIKAYIMPNGESAGQLWRETFYRLIEEHAGGLDSDTFLDACKREFDKLDSEPAKSTDKKSPLRKRVGEP